MNKLLPLVLSLHAPVDSARWLRSGESSGPKFGSDRGTAMKSQPTEIDGHTVHQPGTIIGKAPEPLDGGEGEILVRLSLQ